MLRTLTDKPLLEAFRRGYMDAARILRRGFKPNSLSVNDVQEVRPSMRGILAEVYLNGWNDAKRGDSWRFDKLETLIQRT